METLELEIKLKKWYNASSFIFLVAYILYGTGRRFEDYFWLNYLALSLIIINIILIILTFLLVNSNKTAIKNIKKYYLKIALSFLISVVLGVLVITLF